MLMTTVLVTMYCDRATIDIYIEVYFGVKSIKPLRAKLCLGGE